MEYIQGLNAQTAIFFYSLGFGFLLGILYDVFRTARLIISNSRTFVFIMDFLYFAVCAFLIFCYNLVVDNGRIRIHVVFGAILGWFIYYFSFGAIAVRFSNTVVKAVNRFFTALFKPLKRLSAALMPKNRRLKSNFKKIIKKYYKKIKFVLQKYKGIVYNLNSYNEK